MPATSFLVSFNSDTYQSGLANSFQSIEARAAEGIKVEIDVDAKVKLVPTSLKAFFENYGMNVVDGVHAGWQLYIKEYAIYNAERFETLSSLRWLHSNFIKSQIRPSLQRSTLNSRRIARVHSLAIHLVSV